MDLKELLVPHWFRMHLFSNAWLKRGLRVELHVMTSYEKDMVQWSDRDLERSLTSC